MLRKGKLHWNCMLWLHLFLIVNFGLIPVFHSTFSDSKDIFLLGEECRHEKYSLAIEKRNFRERNRVRAINVAFQELKLIIPSVSQRNKRTSKVKILIKAIQYIRELEAQLERQPILIWKPRLCVWLLQKCIMLFVIIHYNWFNSQNNVLIVKCKKIWLKKKNWFFKC